MATAGKKYIEVSDLINWIKQEVRVWGEDYDMGQLLKDIEDESIPRAIQKPDEKTRTKLPTQDETLGTISMRILETLEDYQMNVHMAQNYCGVNPTTMYGWIDGKGMSPVYKLMLFCKAFNVSLDWLVGLSDSKGIN